MQTALILAPFLAATAYAQAGCTNVSVVGDATYCVQGKICGAEGDACPKKGDVAVASCLKTLKSYVDATKCVAPADATCQKIPSGARGCVFGAAPATTATPAITTTAAPATTAANKNGKCSTNYSQCNGQNWPNGVCCEDPNFECKFKDQYLSTCEPKPKKDVEDSEQAGCTNVSVVGDATYCVQGKICGAEGDACPKKGDVAVASCLKTLKSYVDATKCVAPADATCQKIPSGARGCVFGATTPATTAANKNGKCSTNWSQCNGQNWPHGVCCEDPNYQCNFKNEYLSLCEPKPKMAAEDAESVIARWAQCGGKNFVTNNGVCAPEDKCQAWNEWYSQCIPKPNDDDASAQPRFAQCGGKDYKGNTKCGSQDKCQSWNEWYSQCVPKN
ncbi:Aste57867_10927 [Aphanomyces stellatus]|uniref:Aste57867_10927 protein n=2 Tax=Aphanomyces stellatus TaxID=120398 RepID=A0A485KS25_9STRA|nr:hypothetical protein As57867_010887 [Aphanomyces stellatus]VFT87795.1 Aste57867_10927 [Aphanomyces stellatus]